jgi:hypothetical protein
VAADLSRRLSSVFLRDANGARPVNGGHAKLDHDPHFADLVTFSEYFHGETGAGVGASHQTGWTGVVAKLLQQSGFAAAAPATLRTAARVSKTADVSSAQPELG